MAWHFPVMYWEKFLCIWHDTNDIHIKAFSNISHFLYLKFKIKCLNSIWWCFRLLIDSSTKNLVSSIVRIFLQVINLLQNLIALRAKSKWLNGGYYDSLWECTDQRSLRSSIVTGSEPEVPKLVKKASYKWFLFSSTILSNHIIYNTSSLHTLLCHFLLLEKWRN